MRRQDGQLNLSSDKTGGMIHENKHRSGSVDKIYEYRKEVKNEQARL